MRRPKCLSDYPFFGVRNSTASCDRNDVLSRMRAVIDWKKWTRRQATEYGTERAEFDRDVVNPGWACAYKVGQLKILDVAQQSKNGSGTVVF
jgi:uncharacterized protein (DUF885 family)